MNFVSVGDLSRFFTLRKANAGLRDDIQRLSNEVTTGVKADIPKHLNGDLVEFARIEHGLKETDTYRRIAAEAASTASGMQAALETLQTIADSSSVAMVSDGFLTAEYSLQSVANTAADQLGTVISALNATVGGRFVFAGNRVNAPAIVAKDELLTQARGVISGAASADTAVQLLRDWFEAAPGLGGFSDSAYLGSVEPAGKFGVDPSNSIQFGQTARDGGPREILFGLTLGALVAEGAFAGDHAARSALVQAGGAALSAGRAKIVVARADLGMDEQSIERSSLRLESRATSLQIERSNLVSSDPYEAGSRLVQAEAQLEALFAITARLSGLSLAKYL